MKFSEGVGKFSRRVEEPIWWVEIFSGELEVFSQMAEIFPGG